MKKVRGISIFRTMLAAITISVLLGGCQSKEKELQEETAATSLFSPSAEWYSLQIDKEYMGEYLDNGSPLFTASYPRITLLEKQEGDNGSLKAALDQYNEKVRQETITLYTENLPYFREIYMEFPENFYEYSYERSINIQRGDSRVLSFWDMEYEM